jgi:hypothetical protein
MVDGPEPNRKASSLHEKAAAQQHGRQQKILRQLSRARTRLMVCFLTLPVYMLAVWILLSNQHSTDLFMFLYMGLWAGFAVDMARRRCPNCAEQFFVKSILLNLISKRCVHCGLALHEKEADQNDSVNF